MSDKLFSSQYLNSHVSDFLRYLSLYKHGGTYLDLDVIVLKSFENMTYNYAGAESENFVAAGVLNFQHDGIYTFAPFFFKPFKKVMLSTSLFLHLFRYWT